MHLLAHFISAFHNKVDNDIMSRVDLLVPASIRCGEDSKVAPRRRPLNLRKPFTRTIYAVDAPTVRLIGVILTQCGHIDLFSDHVH